MANALHLHLHFLVHVQHLLRLLGVCCDPVNLILTDQDPVLLDDVEGADVALGGVTSPGRQVASQLLDEHGVSRDLTRGWGAVLLPERHEQRIVVGESKTENRGHRKFVDHVRIVPCVWVNFLPAPCGAGRLHAPPC